jgi:hypothetical protein
VRNAGIVELVIELLRNSSKSIGTHLRIKTLMILLSMAKDEEIKVRVYVGLGLGFLHMDCVAFLLI